MSAPGTMNDRRLNELALFAGAGGGILGGKLLGWRTVCAVELDAFCARRLMQRQNEGHLPPFPIWDDVCSFDGRPWRGIVDVVSGGFPCQDISCAGQRSGITGIKSGLWVEMARIIGEVRPRFALVENSPMLTSRGFGVVLGDLASLGYDARWGVLGACCAGALHFRERMWVLANASGEHKRGQSEFPQERPVSTKPPHNGELWDLARRHPSAWSAEPSVGRVAHGVASRMDRLRAIGNGQVPAVVRLAWETLTGE